MRLQDARPRPAAKAKVFSAEEFVMKGRVLPRPRSSLVQEEGGLMSRFELCLRGLVASLFVAVARPAGAQSFRVQCPTSTITHPASLNNNNAEPAYTGPTTQAANGNSFLAPTANVNGAIKCQQISGGDGYATMADGTQTFMFSFGPLSGLADIAQGLPGTQFPSVFNTLPPSLPAPGDPATSDGASDSSAGYAVGNVNTAPSFTFNGAIGLANDTPFVDTIYDINELIPGKVTVVLNAPSGFNVG